jgi:hypothetical protein
VAIDHVILTKKKVVYFRIIPAKTVVNRKRFLRNYTCCIFTIYTPLKCQAPRAISEQNLKAQLRDNTMAVSNGTVLFTAVFLSLVPGSLFVRRFDIFNKVL